MMKPANKKLSSQQQKPQQNSQIQNPTKAIYENSQKAATNTELLIEMLKEPPKMEDGANPIKLLLEELDKMTKRIEGLESQNKMLMKTFQKIEDNTNRLAQKLLTE